MPGCGGRGTGLSTLNPRGSVYISSLQHGSALISLLVFKPETYNLFDLSLLRFLFSTLHVLRLLQAYQHTCHPPRPPLPTPRIRCRSAAVTEEASSAADHDDFSRRNELGSIIEENH